MHSHEARMFYANAMPSGYNILVIDLFPAIPQAFGEVHERLIAAFDLRSTGEIPGLVTLRSTCTVAAFTEFFGASMDDAQARWDTMRWMAEYRSSSDRTAYAQMDAWKEFYAALTKGVEPIRVELAFIEHA